MYNNYFSDSFSNWKIETITSRIVEKEEALKQYKADAKKEIRKKLAENPKFSSFLKENEIEGKFIKNLAKKLTKIPYEKDASSNILDDIFETEAYIINKAFSWEGTKEGYRYWNDKSKKSQNI